MGTADEIQRIAVTHLPEGEGMIESGICNNLLSPLGQFQWPS